MAAAKVDVFFAPATPIATVAWYAAKDTPIVVAITARTIGITIPHSVLLRA